MTQAYTTRHVGPPSACPRTLCPQALEPAEIRILQRFYDQLCALVEAQRMSDPLCLMVVSKVRHAEQPRTWPYVRSYFHTCARLCGTGPPALHSAMLGHGVVLGT
jgi:hypothetical protein